MPRQRWNEPKSRNVGLFIDLDLYSEALRITAERGSIAALHLRQELSQRTRGLLFVERQSKRVAKDLVRELYDFGWLRVANRSGSSGDSALYALTPAGEAMLELDASMIRRHLAVKMQEHYVIPGWFVARLWKINPSGQGEVILPSPSRDWRPRKRSWEEKEWTPDLAEQVVRASARAQTVCPGSFPIDDQTWVREVSEAWKHLGTWEQRRRSDASGEKVSAFSPRRRLDLAMRSAAVGILFGTVPPGAQADDIRSNKPPLAPRTFRVWCPRLAELELIFYTDRHPDIVGRLVFATSVFRRDTPRRSFEKLDAIRNPDGDFLWLYQPTWEKRGDVFLQKLVEIHRLISRRAGTLYVSLLDVRDEVCRTLRLSAALFDRFLARAFRESLRPGAARSISIETDIREDQRGASGLVRRPVRIDRVPYSLIAIGKTSP